jgi:hypothetical protein
MVNPLLYFDLFKLSPFTGHTHIDLLKIDIERWEFETLTALVKPYIANGKPLPFGQLSLEIHLWNLSFAEFLTWWESLEAAGLRPFWTEVSSHCSTYLLALTDASCSRIWCTRTTTAAARRIWRRCVMIMIWV